ncbi:hypothetical protein SAY87_022233 [Trapa incisa]|uniref:Uncharacterized protein n=1 Tax=Trapa incisa TaxID=236973 RepID=A0AAN7JS23_9MYRT|nr:hypothetical protein SAY87_022233 [Trapa incisa]
MEAAAAPYWVEHHGHSLPLSADRSKHQIRSATNSRQALFHLSAFRRSSEDFDPGSNVGGGVLSRTGSYCNHGSKQPPLLPLPVNSKVHMISSHPTTNSGKPMPQRLRRHSSLNPNNKPQMRRQGSLAVTRNIHGPDNKLAVAFLGPDPNELPKNMSISMFPNPSSLNSSPMESSTMFSSSVFELAPPPSSLPLPKFSLMPKLGCKAEVGAADSGAIEVLRRILRLR